MYKSKNSQAPVALTIAGSDSSGTVGMQADLLTFAANGVFGVTALTCVTAQSPDGISGVETLDPDFVIRQAEEVSKYFPIEAAKTGMLRSEEMIEKVAEFFAHNRQIKLVVDPVLVSSKGSRFVTDDALVAYEKKLLPLAHVITPNLDEAQILFGQSLRTLDELTLAAKELACKWDSTVYLKGGHLGGDTLHDVFCPPSGEPISYAQRGISSINPKGSGCTLSACIASHLAKGVDHASAVDRAREYLRAGMERPIVHSAGRFINHFPESRFESSRSSSD